MVVKAPVVFKEIVVFKDAISLKTQDPAPFPNFGDFKHFFDDFSRLHSLSVLSERAQLGKVLFGIVVGGGISTCYTVLPEGASEL